MIVVADTSVLLNLALIGEIDLLHNLFGSVIAPQAVHDEFARLAATSGRFAGLSMPSWVNLQGVSDSALVTQLRATLDEGESEAIALAIEIHAEAVLMDETEGRCLAQARGLRTIGIVGILIQARHVGLVSELGPLFLSLRERAKFRLSAKIMNEALIACGEDTAS
jgi:uncharacterized protein